MRKLTSLVAALVFASLFVFTSCGGKEPDNPPGPKPGAVEGPLTKAAKKLVQGWTVNAADVKYKGGNPEAQWKDFKLTFKGDSTGGTYTTSGIPKGYEKVWGGGSGKWNFDGTSAIVREDKVKVTLSSLTESALSVSFTVPEAPASRTSGISGAWVFTFKK